MNGRMIIRVLTHWEQGDSLFDRVSILGVEPGKKEAGHVARKCFKYDESIAINHRDQAAIN